MQRFSLAAVAFILLVAPLAADNEFFNGLTPADISAAGLDQLSADQRAKLGALVEAYKKGAVQEDRREAARQVTAPAESADAAKHGFLSKLKVTLLPGTKVEYASVTSTIRGKFSGWGEHTVFVLANGQSWQVANGGSYFTPPRENVAVEIVPASLGGFWMNIPELHTEVRVKPVGTH